MYAFSYLLDHYSFGELVCQANSPKISLLGRDKKRSLHFSGYFNQFLQVSIEFLQCKRILNRSIIAN